MSIKKVQAGSNVRDVNSEINGPKITLQYVTGEEVLPIWPEIQGFIQKAADYARGEWEPVDVLVRVQSLQQQAWVWRQDGKVRAVLVTELIEYPRQIACNLFAFAGWGVAQIWKQFLPLGIEWLEAHRVSVLEATCRDEVLRSFTPLGFRPVANLIRFNWREES